MSTFQSSTQDLRNTATNATTICSAIGKHPVHQLAGGDFGHAGVAAAVAAFQKTWAGELMLRQKAAEGASRFLRTAASDTDRVDVLLARAASKLVGK